MAAVDPANKKEEWQPLKIIVGLGNPGKHYEATRHNLGFVILDRLGTKFGADFQAVKHLKADVSKTTINGNPVLLVKPTTYMNLSGLSVSAVTSWYKVPIADFLIIHDDVSLPLGKIRLQKSGGAGGQHGVESIIESLGGAKDFNRLKIGVGPDPGGDLRANFVLSVVPEADRSLLERVVDLSLDAALCWLNEDIKAAMNEFNGKDLANPANSSSENDAALDDAIDSAVNLKEK